MVLKINMPDVTEQLEPTFADPFAPNFRRVGSSPREPRMDPVEHHQFIASNRAFGALSWRSDLEDGAATARRLENASACLPNSRQWNEPYPPTLGQHRHQQQQQQQQQQPRIPERRVGESYVDLVRDLAKLGHSQVPTVRSLPSTRPEPSDFDIYRIRPTNPPTPQPAVSNPRFVFEDQAHPPRYRPQETSGQSATRTFGTQVTPREACNAQNRQSFSWFRLPDMENIFGGKVCQDLGLAGAGCCQNRDPANRRVLSVSKKPMDRWPMGGYEKRPQGGENVPPPYPPSYEDANENGHYVL